MFARRHFPVLDGLRGIAIVAVLLRHSAYVFQAHGPATRWLVPILQFGNWGVDLFFVLSGFLITGILLETRQAFNRAQSFYGRRILRIFPVYYLALLALFFLAQHSFWTRSALNLQCAADYRSYLLYIQNWLPLWHHGEYPESILSHFWSLAVEEQFYLIWPAVVWHCSNRVLIRVCAIALGLVFLVRLLLVLHFGHGIWVYALTITRADGLLVGSALAAIYARHDRFSHRLLSALTASGLAGLAAIVALGPAREIWLTGARMAMFGLPAVALLSGALIASSLQNSETLPGTLLQARWLRSFGKYSYGMYVWHFPLYYWVQHLFEERGVPFPLPTAKAIPYVIGLYAASYLAAWLSFHCFEQWFLRLKTRFEPIFTQQPNAQPAPAESLATQ